MHDPFSPQLRKIGRGDVFLGTPTSPRDPTPAAPKPIASSPSTPSCDPPAPSPECPGCSGAGWYVVRVPYGHPQWGVPQRCECMRGVPTPRQVAQMARLRSELGDLADRTFETFNLERYLDPAFTWQGAPFPAAVQRGELAAAYATAQAYAATLRGWLYFYGGYGSGKSHLAAAIVNAAAERQIVGAYASVPRLLDFVKDGYGDNTSGERLRALVEAPLLVLDDLGTEALTPTNRQLLFDLLNARDESQGNRATVITSNVHFDDPRFDGRIGDRIAGMIGPGGERLVVLPVSSYRRRHER